MEMLDSIIDLGAREEEDNEDEDEGGGGVVDMIL